MLRRSLAATPSAFLVIAALHVDLQHEVHAAAQVQAQVHGPARSAAIQVGERDSRFSATT
jgi:hypothetical protein